ncbi:MAG: hypothetical protein ABSF63_00160 [Candidatus Bathyarchaeia archaeon]|jgi:hypothetical protein
MSNSNPSGKPLHGFLDHLRENLETLDEQITLAQKNSKGNGGLQWAKLTRDLIEQRNMTLDRIKAHFLGRTEVGNIKEPEDYYGNNPEVEFERKFRTFLAPWNRKDLNLQCDECRKESEDVTQHRLVVGKDQWGYDQTEDFDLCPKCYDKRTIESTGEGGNADPVAAPASKVDIRVMLQSARLMIRTLKGLPLDQRITKLEEMLADKFEVAPGMEPAHEAYRALLQKELDKAKMGSHQ